MRVAKNWILNLQTWCFRIAQRSSARCSSALQCLQWWAADAVQTEIGAALSLAARSTAIMSGRSPEPLPAYIKRAVELRQKTSDPQQFTKNSSSATGLWLLLIGIFSIFALFFIRLATQSSRNAVVTSSVCCKNTTKIKYHLRSLHTYNDEHNAQLSEIRGSAQVV